MDSIVRDHAPWVMGAAVMVFWIAIAVAVNRRRAPPKRKRRTKYRLIEPDAAFQNKAETAAARQIDPATVVNRPGICIDPVQFDDRVLAYFEGYPPLEGETRRAYSERVGKELGIKFGFASIETVPVPLKR